MNESDGAISPRFLDERPKGQPLARRSELVVPVVYNDDLELWIDSYTCDAESPVTLTVRGLPDVDWLCSSLVRPAYATSPRDCVDQYVTADRIEVPVDVLFDHLCGRPRDYLRMLDTVCCGPESVNRTAQRRLSALVRQRVAFESTLSPLRYRLRDGHLLEVTAHFVYKRLRLKQLAHCVCLCNMLRSTSKAELSRHVRMFDSLTMIDMPRMAELCELAEQCMVLAIELNTWAAVHVTQSLSARRRALMMLVRLKMLE
jgi:mRNA-degrading endonuclease toxin of MazEF toxin-antitoxin module